MTNQLLNKKFYAYLQSVENVVCQTLGSDFIFNKMQVCDRRQGFGNPLEKAVYENDCF